MDFDWVYIKNSVEHYYNVPKIEITFSSISKMEKIAGAFGFLRVLIIDSGRGAKWKEQNFISIPSTSLRIIGLEQSSTMCHKIFSKANFTDSFEYCLFVQALPQKQAFSEEGRY